MLLQHWGIGQWDFIWDIRCNKNVLNVFFLKYGIVKIRIY